MKHEYRIDNQDRIFYTTISGECTAEDLESILDTLANDSNFNPDYDELVDLRNCDFQFGPNDVENFFEKYNTMFDNAKGKCAILVDDPKETALALFHRKKTGFNRELKVFSTIEAAMGWLKLSL